MTTTKLFVSTLTTCLLAALPLAAQEVPAGPEVEAAAPALRDPMVRVDFALPAVGVTGTSADGSGWQASIGVRVAHQSGHGVRFDLSAGQTRAIQFLSSSAYVSSTSYDLSYLYRVRLVGDDRLGIGMDFGAGLAVQTLFFNQPTSWFGSSPPHVNESIADGVHMGGVAIAAIDGRVYGFTFGADVRAHAVFATQGQSGDSVAQYDVSLNTSLGFGFY